MAVSQDTRLEQPHVVEAGAPPPVPPAPPQMYDAARNKGFGITTVEEILAEFHGNQQALAARVRQDADGRRKKTFDDLIERISAGLRTKALKATLTGTKRSTEAMATLTGVTAPTSQTQIQLGDFGPWAIPEVQRMMQRSRVEVEPGAGVPDFEMPSERIIIEIGQAAAKKAGCWGVPQVVRITGAAKAVETVDLPKAVGWQENRKSPFPWWKDQGPLAAPWQDFHLFSEVVESSLRQDQPVTWGLDLFCRDGETVMFRERGFIARFADSVIVSAVGALDQLRPHISFIVADNVGDGDGADPADDEAVVRDATGRRHLTLDEIAASLSITPIALVERLRGRGYLTLRGEATPAALDAGITTILDGGTRFSFDAISRLFDTQKSKPSFPLRSPSCHWNI
jgi:hypothetical protein